MAERIKNSGIFLVFMILSAVALANGQTALTSKDLPNFGAVNAGLYRGGQPTEAGIKELARRGVKTVIDLRGEDKLAEQEKTWVQNAGMKFIAVDLSNWFKPKDEVIASILKEIETNENQPVFVHCKRGADRTGTVLAVYRISHDGWTAEQAKAEASRYHLGWWQFQMKDYIGEYYAKSQVKNRSH